MRPSFRFRRARPAALLVVAFFCLACFVAVAAVAQPGAAHAHLPPRPALTPAPSPSASATPAPVDQPVRIRLVVTATSAQPLGVWSLVQWQSGDGAWHDVDGWLGAVGPLPNGQIGKQWRVLPRDYDTGPFRWVMLEAPGGAILAASASFALPNAENRLRVVEMAHGDVLVTEEAE